MSLEDAFATMRPFVDIAVLIIGIAISIFVLQTVAREMTRLFDDTESSDELERKHLSIIRDALLEEDKRKNDDPVTSLELDMDRFWRGVAAAAGQPQPSPADQVEAFDEKPKREEPTEFILGDDGELIEVPLRRFEEEEA